MNKVDEEDESGRPAPAFNQWTIWVGVPITRRKYYHLISNPEGEIVFNTMHFSEILQYLEDADISNWRLCTESKTWGVARQWCRTRHKD